jgi:hypothetical protein
MLTYLAFFLVIFTAAVSTFMFLQTQETARAENAYAQQIAYSFANSIQNAFIAGPGFYQNVTIPQSLLGKPYTIAVSHADNPIGSQTGMVYVEWNSPGQSGSFSAPTITTNYSAVACCSPPLPSYIQNIGNLIVINSSVGNINMYNINGQIRFTQGAI